jgi:hypothetical protein
MSTQTTSGLLSRPLIHRTRPTSSSPCSSSRCSGTRVTSPYTLVADFLRRQVDATPIERARANGRAELCELLEIEVTDVGYRLLVGPLLAAASADGQRLSDDDIARHGRWWLDQLP